MHTLRIDENGLATWAAPGPTVHPPIVVGEVDGIKLMAGDTVVLDKRFEKAPATNFEVTVEHGYTVPGANRAERRKNAKLMRKAAAKRKGA